MLIVSCDVVREAMQVGASTGHTLSDTMEILIFIL